MARPPKDHKAPDPGTAIQRFTPSDDFQSAARAACFSLSASPATRKAYWSDASMWFRFCEERGVDLWQPHPVAVTAWMVEMEKSGAAPKTQQRRLSALSSIYDRVRRDHLADRRRKKMVNPFDTDHGPKRRKANALEPTPIAQPDDVLKMLASCETDPAGVRDAAILRTLWSTGARCASIVSMTWEKLAKDPAARPDSPIYTATAQAKGGKEIRLLIEERAATALEAWLAELRRAGFTSGPIWRNKTGTPMNEKAVWKAIKLRAERSGVVNNVSPHMFRVAFLTLNPASIQSKQDAAGHADPKTTASYDRHDWRGREAFESMPDPEDVK